MNKSAACSADAKPCAKQRATGSFNEIPRGNYRIPSVEEMAAGSLQSTVGRSLLLIKVTVYLCITLLLPSCSSMQSRSDSKGIGFTESGKASFYAMKYQSKKTASGARLDNYAFTAAHKTLPFGTKVKVTNLKNGKSVTVTVNDRGPFVEGRVIDLTQSAFRKIGNIESGVIHVNIKVVE